MRRLSRSRLGRELFDHPSYSRQMTDTNLNQLSEQDGQNASMGRLNSVAIFKTTRYVKSSARDKNVQNDPAHTKAKKLCMGVYVDFTPHPSPKF